MKRIIATLISIVLIVCFAGCADTAPPSESRSAELSGVSLINDTEFGGVFLDVSIEEFNALGFEFGDGVNIEFSNGEKLRDIPYYDGYYAKTGSPLLCGYPGYEHVKLGFCNGPDMRETLGINDTMTATVTLASPDEYAAVQSAMSITYLNDRERFESDEMFANFRAVKTNGLRRRYLYRSASPCDNQYNRAGYTDRLAKDANIKYILNLTDTEERIESYIGADDFSSPYFLSLYEEGNVKLIRLSMNYESDEFAQTLVEGLMDLSCHEGPYLIHCTEGKDRTGFVCFLLEALTGATYDEMKDDYMETYNNYYHINSKTDAEKYNNIVELKFDSFVEFLASLCYDLDKIEYESGAELAAKVNLAVCARQYLQNAGMSDFDYGQLLSALSKKTK